MNAVKRSRTFKVVMMLVIGVLAVAMTMPMTANAANKHYSSTKSKGKLTYTLSCNDSSYYYNKNDKCTRVKTTTTWNWSKCPKMWCYTDSIAVGNGQGFTVRQVANCKKNNYCTPYNVANCKVTYYLGPHQSGDKSGKYAPRTVNMTVKINGSGKGAYVNVPMMKVYTINGVKCNFYAKKGTLTVNWEKQGKVSPASFASNYGHRVFYAKPNVSINGFDLKFGKCIVKGDNTYISMKKSL